HAWFQPTKPTAQLTEAHTVMTKSRSLGVLTGTFFVVAGCTGAVDNTPGSGGSGSGAGSGASGSGSSSGSGTGGKGASGSGGSGGSGSGTGRKSGTGGGAGPGSGGSGGTAADCTPLDALPRRLWRLSVEQWGAAVKDLLS